MTERVYARCNVAGEGKLYIQDSEDMIKFKVVDMSAEGINIETAAELSENAAVDMEIRLKVGSVYAYLDLKGKVVKPVENGYNIEFVDIPVETRDEIDEMMRNSCDLE